MRLLVSADLHYNNHRSRGLCDELIDRMNAAGGDAVLLVGDTAAGDGDFLEQCLGRFTTTGSKLIVAGNHELWTAGPDSYRLYREELPRRLAAIGWHLLDAAPYLGRDLAIVGSVGWYDYSFAPADLGVPRRFYEAKVAPGAAAMLRPYAHLLERTDDIDPAGRNIISRWNDGRFIKLHRSDEQFLEELLARLEEHLQTVAGKQHVLAAIHHLPFRELLPPPHNAQWDFAKAFLGSARMGQVLLKYSNVRQVVCGHSHLPAELAVGHIQVTNIGGGYRWKTYVTLDLPD